MRSKGFHHSEETKRKIGDANRGKVYSGKLLSLEHRRKIGESMRGEKHYLYGKHLSEETKRKMSEAHKGKPSWNRGLTKNIDEGVRRMAEARIGEGNPAWRGGISFEPYTSEFNRILKEQIKRRDCFICQWCGTDKRLAIHHIDYNKKNNTPLNLITLCKCCNSKMNFNREYWMKFWDNMSGLKILLMD